jgi:hypothetical protein
MKFILKNWSIIVLLSIPAIMGVVWIRDKMYVSQVEYLVFEGGGNGMEEGKLYIRDKEKAQRVVQIFIRNHSLQHACGYWYTLTGYDKNGRKIFEEGLNGECDEFWFRDTEIQDFIKSCRKQLSKPEPRKK